MADLIYSTSMEVPGPWLIDQSQFESLDEILSSEVTKLEATRESSLNAALAETTARNAERQKGLYEQLMPALTSSDEYLIRTKPEFRPLRQRIDLHMRSGRKLRVARLAEAIRHEAVLEDVVVGFEILVDVGRLECRLELERRVYSSALSLRVSPETDQAARELFVVLRQWVAASKPPAWLQVWKRLNGLQWILLPLVILIAAVFVSVISTNPYKEKARKLLTTGVDQSNLPQAVEVILALQADVQPTVYQFDVSKRAMAIVVCAVGIAVITSITPKQVVGLGRGAALVGRWRWWSRFVMITIPATIFATFVWPYLTDLVKAIF